MKFRLKISSPHGLFFNDYVETINIKTTQGYETILYDHIPIITALEIASMTFRTNGVVRTCAIAGGVMHVTKEETFIITDAIEYKEDIDINRAQNDYNNMVRQLEEKANNLNQTKAELSMKKALNRIKTHGG